MIAKQIFYAIQSSQNKQFLDSNMRAFNQKLGSNNIAKFHSVQHAFDAFYRCPVLDVKTKNPIKIKIKKI